MSNRKFERKSTTARVHILFPKSPVDALLVCGELVDISEGGAGLEVDDTPEAMERIHGLQLTGELTLQLPDAGAMETLAVQSVWVEKHEPTTDSRVRAGFRFSSHPDAIDRIRKLISLLPQRPHAAFA